MIVPFSSIIALDEETVHFFWLANMAFASLRDSPYESSIRGSYSCRAQIESKLRALVATTLTCAVSLLLVATGASASRARASTESSSKPCLDEPCKGKLVKQPKANQVVATVAGTPITMLSFEHWLTVTVDLSPEIAVGSKKAKLDMPKPPEYTACVTQLGSGKPGTSKAKLEAQCEKEYLKLAGNVLGFLITSDWVLAEAAHLSLTVSEAEVQTRFEEAKAKQYRSVEQFNSYLVSSGETVADLLWRTKVQLLQAEILQSVTTGKGQPESKEALTAYQGEFLNRWRVQTSCSSGFVMSDCKQYESSGSSVRRPEGSTDLARVSA